MKILAISDLHGDKPDLPYADVLVIAGDCTENDQPIQWKNFYDWFIAQPHPHKILVAGNHDMFLENTISSAELRDLLEYYPEEWNNDFEYLCDSGVTIDGVKFWGSPWTYRFPGINPSCTAFTSRSHAEYESHFDKIPEDTDVLITHCPPFSVLDKSKHEQRCGSKMLQLITYQIKPKLHVFGHIHEDGGKSYVDEGIRFANVAYLNERYDRDPQRGFFIYDTDEGKWHRSCGCMS